MRFLHRLFLRTARRYAWPCSNGAALVAYQEELQEVHPEKLSGKADVYLTDWCSSRWLGRFLEAGRDEAVLTNDEIRMPKE